METVPLVERNVTSNNILSCSRDVITSRYNKSIIILGIFIIFSITLQITCLIFMVQFVHIARNIDLLYPLNKEEIITYSHKLEKLIDYACVNIVKC
jgi:hypothetical protein